jgi:hypothetical protein
MIHYLARPNFLVPSRAANYATRSSISQIGNGQKCIDSVMSIGEAPTQDGVIESLVIYNYLYRPKALKHLIAARCGFANTPSHFWDAAQGAVIRRRGSLPVCNPTFGFQ